MFMEAGVALHWHIQNSQFILFQYISQKFNQQIMLMEKRNHTV